MTSKKFWAYAKECGKIEYICVGLWLLYKSELLYAFFGDLMCTPLIDILYELNGLVAFVFGNLGAALAVISFFAAVYDALKNKSGSAIIKSTISALLFVTVCFLPVLFILVMYYPQIMSRLIPVQ